MSTRTRSNAFIAIAGTEATLDQFDRAIRSIAWQITAAAIIYDPDTYLQIHFAVVICPSVYTPVVRLAVVFVTRIIDHDILPCTFIISVGIKHVSKYRTQWIFIQGAVVVAFAIYKCAFLNIKPEVTADDDIRWALNKRADLILYFGFDHAVVNVAGSIRDFEFDHYRSIPYIAACKRHTWAVYSSAVTTVDCRYTTRMIINTSAFRCPVKVDTAIHSPCPEGHRTTVIIAAIIKYTCRYQGDSTRAIIGQAYNSMLITVGYRYYIIYYGNMESTATAIATLIRYNPGNGMCTQFQSIDDIVVTKGHYNSISRYQAIACNFTAIIHGLRFGHADISVAVPEVSSHFIICRTCEHRTFIVHELNHLHRFNKLYLAPVKYGPCTNDLTTSATFIQFFIPVPDENIAQVIFIGDWGSIYRWPSGVIWMSAFTTYTNISFREVYVVQGEWCDRNILYAGTGVTTTIRCSPRPGQNLLIAGISGLSFGIGQRDLSAGIVSIWCAWYSEVIIHIERYFVEYATISAYLIGNPQGPRSNGRLSINCGQCTLWNHSTSKCRWQWITSSRYSDTRLIIKSHMIPIIDRSAELIEQQYGGAGRTDEFSGQVAHPGMYQVDGNIHIGYYRVGRYIQDNFLVGDRATVRSNGQAGWNGLGDTACYRWFVYRIQVSSTTYGYISTFNDWLDLVFYTDGTPAALVITLVLYRDHKALANVF